tara:strand:- start:995 stop:1132 length:138 start_codon:yes stop_codon:yes gene_type:complete
MFFYIKINKLFTNPRESAVQDGAFVALLKKYSIKKRGVVPLCKDM